jgi:hypothetical protein
MCLLGHEAGKTIAKADDPAQASELMPASASGHWDVGDIARAMPTDGTQLRITEKERNANGSTIRGLPRYLVDRTRMVSPNCVSLR